MSSPQTDLPTLEGFETFYGVQVSSVGEDGALLILGHHERRRALAALNRYSRVVIGLSNLFDGHRGAGYADAEGGLRECWAVQITECEPGQHDAEPEGLGCPRCAELAEGPWWINWRAKESDAGAFPVMIWEV